MLDKSVPLAGFFMRRKAGTAFEPTALPDGFSFVFYEDGDERYWADIETSVLEFDSVFSALMYFAQTFRPFSYELCDRCLFIENDNGGKIATATAWYEQVGGRRRPWLHWVAVRPEYQGLGLGSALVSRVTEVMTALEGDADFYLHTQTWSHRAVGIYRKFGYEMTDEKALYTGKRDNYIKAVKILKHIK